VIKYFKIYELVPQPIYDKRGEKAWQLLDYRALKTLEWLRESLGQCTVNNWYWDGQYSQSGFRTEEAYIRDSAYLKSLSQHKYGRAFDCKFKDYTAEEARQWILEEWENSGFDWPITLEEDVSWLHFDVRNRPENKVYTFKP